MAAGASASATTPVRNSETARTTLGILGGSAKPTIPAVLTLRDDQRDERQRQHRPADADQQRHGVVEIGEVALPHRAVHLDAADVTVGEADHADQRVAAPRT